MTFSATLKRYFPVVTLSLIALIAYLQARAVTLLASILVDAFVPARPSLTHPAVAAPAEPKTGQPILDRNPFDSTPRAPMAVAGNVDLSDPLSWPTCPNIQVSIVTQSSDPTWSLTTVRVEGEPRARLRRVGDKVADKQVAFIGYNPKQLVPAVWLEGAQGSCQSPLFTPAVAAPDPKPASVATVAEQSAPLESLSRSRVEEVLKDPMSALRSVRVVPEVKDGEPVGLRLYGIRPSSLLGSIGVRNGDRLETINGFDMANPEKALQAYARLRNVERLDVHLVRSGKPVDLTLRID